MLMTCAHCLWWGEFLLKTSTLILNSAERARNDSRVNIFVLQIMENFGLGIVSTRPPLSLTSKSTLGCI